MRGADKYASFRIEMRAGELCAVLKRKQLLHWPDGVACGEVICSERSLAIRLSLAAHNGDASRLFDQALKALRAASPRGPAF